MGMIVPTLSGDAGVWDDELNAALGLVDTHDHTPGKGVKVPVSGLNINADFPLGGNGLTTVGRVAFSQVAALSTGSVTLFVNTTDHELYWRNAGGTNVKLTAGGSINTTLVGGIVGDYAAVGAEVAYDDANKRYTFKQQGSKPWARMASGDVRLYEFNTTEAVYTALKVASALAASYDITLPVAAPASQVMVQMDASGVLTVSNTLASAPSAPDYKFTTILRQQKGMNVAETLFYTNGGANGCGFLSTGSNWAWMSSPLDCAVGDTFTNVRIGVQTSAGTLAVAFYAQTVGAAPTLTNIASWTVPVAGAGIYEKSDFNVPIAADLIYCIGVNGNTTGEAIMGVEVGRKRP